MTKQLTIRDSSRVLIKEKGYTFVIYPLLADGMYVGSVEFNMYSQTCKILNLFEDIPKNDIENCVYNKRIQELEALKEVSHEDSFDILDNLLNDLREKIHE